MKNITIVCPSHLRSDSVLTLAIVPDLILVVRHDELEDYKANYPDVEILTTPKGLKGIVKTRQWILEQFDSVFMLDDDITHITRMYAEAGEDATITDPKFIKELINRDAHIAKQLGAYHFGYTSSRNPLEYRCHRPYKLTGYLNGSYSGFLKGHGLYYPVMFEEAEDHFISCLNVYKNRFMFINTMFAFSTKDNFLAKGGCNDSRTTENMLANTMRLRQTFGEVVTIKGVTKLKKNVHVGERTISFPI